MYDWILGNYQILLIGFAAGLLLMSLVCLLLLNKAQHKVKAADQILQQQVQSLQFEKDKSLQIATQLSSVQLQLQERFGETVQLREQLRRAEISIAKSERDQLHHHEQLKLLAENKELLKQEFSSLANDIFEKKHQSFNEQSKHTLSTMLDPFQKQIEQFRQRVDDIHVRDSEGRSQLVTQLTMLRDMNSQLNQQASDLTKALKGDKKLQGNWGELQIERILETSGLQKGREYEREANFKDDEGANRRPDFIIRLPENKHIIIDSKVSLVAYQAAVNEEDSSARDIAMRNHVGAIRSHIKSLSEKNYSALKGMNAPDFVLMFMPIESAFVAAFEYEPQLFNEAFDRQIVIVTPTTLLATLKTIANIWVLQRQNENAQQLFKLAGKIYDKLAIFSQKMDRMGSQISTTEKSWHEAMSSLRDGRGSLLTYVHRLKDLGAPTSKQMSESFSKVDDFDSHDSNQNNEPHL